MLKLVERMWQGRVLVIGIVLAIALSIAPSGTQAAANQRGLSTAVYLSDGTKFPGWNQWSSRDGGWIDSAKWIAGDFNGDKKSDIATIWNNGGSNTITVSQANDSRFTRTHWATNAGGWVDTTAWLAGDFNGDGKTDIAASWNDGGLLSTAVYLSDGTKFPGWTQWSQRDGGWIDNAKWVAGDFNGDGKDDIAAIWNNRDSNTLTVSLSTGSGFTRSHWATNAGGWAETTAWLSGDFNGDGKADIAASWNDQSQLSTAVYLSDGTKFPNWTQWSQRDGGWIDGRNAKWVAGDFNGDGKDDIAAIWNNGGSNTLTVSQSTGSSFTRSHWATNAGGWLDTTAWRAGDFNGDGKTDIAAAWDDADVPIPESLPEPQRPGQHTMVLRADRVLTQGTVRRFSDAPLFGAFIGRGLNCSHGYSRGALSQGSGESLVAITGWGQVEGDGHPDASTSPCVSWVNQLALNFDTRAFDNLPRKTLDRVVLAYREGPAAGCAMMVYTQGGYLVDSLPCWTDGEGNPEHKPNGCLSLQVPSENWVLNPPQGRVLGWLESNFGVSKSGPSSWDVTNLFRSRHMPGLGASYAGVGYMLMGEALTVGNLDAEDNTRCTSALSDIRLEITYTVPPFQPAGDLPVIR